MLWQPTYVLTPGNITVQNSDRRLNTFIFLHWFSPLHVSIQIPQWKISVKANLTHQWTPIRRLQGVKKKRLFSGWVTPPSNAHSRKTVNCERRAEWTASHRSFCWLVRRRPLSWYWPIELWCVDRSQQSDSFLSCRLVSLHFYSRKMQIVHLKMHAAEHHRL